MTAVIHPPQGPTKTLRFLVFNKNPDIVNGPTENVDSIIEAISFYSGHLTFSHTPGDVVMFMFRSLRLT